MKNPLCDTCGRVRNAKGDFFCSKLKGFIKALKKITGRKSVALFVVMIMALNQPGVCSNAWSFQALEVGIKSPKFQLDLPPDLGTVQNLISGPGPTVIHIQTAHGNYDAQKKIQAILRFLRNTCGIDSIFVEGSASNLNPELLRFVPGQLSRNREVAESLTQKGLLKGVELFLLEEPKIRVRGIESLGEYVSNGQAFETVIAEQEKTKSFLRATDLQIDRLASPYLNKKLRGFLKKIDDYETKKIVPLPDWLEYLKSKAQETLDIDLTDARFQLDWPMLFRLFRLKTFEAKLNLNTYAKEKNAFLAAIRPIPQETYREIEKLLSAPLSQSELPDPETGLLIEHMVSRLPASFRFDLYPNVKLFLGHLILRSELKAGRLMEEADLLAEKISGKLAQTEEEKKLLSAFRDDRLLRRLFALELTPDDYENLLKRGERIRPKNLIAEFLPGINRESRVRDAEFGSLDEIESLFDKVMEFYQWARKRDRSMIRNLESLVAESGTKRAVVITGGFHSGPFTDYFKAAGYSYALIAPNISDTGGKGAYVHSALKKGFRFLKTATLEDPFLSDPLLERSDALKAIIRAELVSQLPFFKNRRSSEPAGRAELRSATPVFADFKSAALRYYQIKAEMMKALDKDEPENFRKLHEELESLADVLPRYLPQAGEADLLEVLQSLTVSSEVSSYLLPQKRGIVDSSAILKELSAISDKSFDPQTRQFVDTIVEEVASELYDGPKKKAMKEQMLKDIQTFHVSNLMPKEEFEADFSVWKHKGYGYVRALSEVAGGSWGAFNTLLKKIVLQTQLDELVLRSTLKHEIVHYLADSGEIKIPTDWESITYAIDLIERIKHAPGGESNLDLYAEEFGEPALAGLYARGKEMGLQGVTGFMVHPGVSDRQAGYFAMETLLAEARGVYDRLKLPAERLLSPYSAQRAVALLIAGVLIGMEQKESQKPFALLRDFFETLHERYAPPSQEELREITKSGGLLDEMKSYGSALAGRRLNLLSSPAGFWNYEASGDTGGQLDYVISDLYPRLYDGTGPDDIAGKRAAARERGLGHTLLAFARKFYVREPRLSEEIQRHTAFRPLWETLMTPQVVFKAIERNGLQIDSLVLAKNFEGAPSWIVRLFEDRYNLGSQPLVEQALLNALPLHLQYLDSLLYRFAKSSPDDPRIRNADLDKALRQSYGLFDNVKQTGWGKMMLDSKSLSEAEWMEAVSERIWPEYLKLFEKAVEAEKRKKLYEQMMREDYKKSVEEYWKDLPQEQQNEMMDQVMQAMQQAVEDYMQGQSPSAMPGMGQEGEGAGTGRGMGRPGGKGMPQQGSANPEQIGAQLQQLESQIGQLEKQMQNLSAGLSQVENQAAQAGQQAQAMGAGKQGRPEKAEQLQQQASGINDLTQQLLDGGRNLQQGASGISGQTQSAAQHLGKPTPAADAEELEKKAQALIDKLTKLQGQANKLKHLTGQLQQSVSQPVPDESHVSAQGAAVKETTEGMQQKLQGSQGDIRNLSKLTHQIQKGVAQLQQSLQSGPGKASKGSSQKGPSSFPESGKGADQGSEGTGEGQGEGSQSPAANLPPPPQTFGLQQMAGSSRLSQGRTKPSRKGLFDQEYLDAMALTEQLRLEEMTGLNATEQNEYQKWLDQQLTDTKGRSVTVRKLIDDTTKALRVLTLPLTGLEVESPLERGTILTHPVDGVVSGKPFGKRVESEAIPVKLSFVIDRSGSMGGDPIYYAKLTALVLLEALFNHNKERSSLGFEPIEFEVGLFTMDQDLLISHKTSGKYRHFQKQRVIYDVLKQIQSGGGTQYSKALAGFLTRLEKAPDRTSEKSERMLIAVSDEDVGDAQLGEVLAAISTAEKKGVSVVIVPAGNPAQVEQSFRTHGNRTLKIEPVTSMPVRIAAHIVTQLVSRRGFIPTAFVHRVRSEVRSEGEIKVSKERLTNLKAEFEKAEALIRSLAKLKDRASNDQVRERYEALYAQVTAKKERLGTEIAAFEQELVRAGWGGKPDRVIQEQTVTLTKAQIEAALTQLSYYNEEQDEETVIVTEQVRGFSYDEYVVKLKQPRTDRIPATKTHRGLPHEEAATLISDLKVIFPEQHFDFNTSSGQRERHPSAKSVSGGRWRITSFQLTPAQRDLLADAIMDLQTKIDISEFMKADAQTGIVRQINLKGLLAALLAENRASRSSGRSEMRSNANAFDTGKNLEYPKPMFQIPKNISKLEVSKPASRSEMRSQGVEKTSPLEKVRGYSNFYTQTVDGRSSLVWKRGNQELRWERGLGGPYVPKITMPDIDFNEGNIVKMLMQLYRQGVTYTSYSPDGRYLVRTAESGRMELYERGEKTGEWTLLNKFNPLVKAEVTEDGPSSKVWKNVRELRWQWQNEEKQFSISQINGNFVTVQDWDPSWNEEAVLDEITPEKISVYLPSQQRVVLLEFKEGVWKAAHDLAVEKETPENVQEGKVVALRGETGLGKGVLIRAAAHLMNEQVFFIAANEDMEKEQLEELRTLGVEISGVSGYLPTVMTLVQHYGGWVVIDEAHKLRDKVINAMKPKIASRRHVWRYPNEEGGKERHEVVDHPRARILATMNVPRAGMVSVARHGDQAMQRRFRILDFFWGEPSEEVQVHMHYALELAKQLGRYRHEDPSQAWTAEDTEKYETQISEMIENLMRVATHARLVFAGYNAEQIRELLKPYGWRKLGSFDFKPANPAGKMLQRAPSPRAIKNMVLHFIRYPEDWRSRKWSSIERYYNFYAEKDPEKAYASFKTEFQDRGGFKDDPAAQTMSLDASSFSVRNGKLVVRPVDVAGKPDPKWDEVVVPLHPDASLHRGVLPDKIRWLIRSPENAKLIYQMLQAYESNRDVILVGEQETGKSTIGDAVQELVGGPDILEEAVSYQTSKEDLTYRPHMGEDGRPFQSGFLKGPLPTAMNHKGQGKPIGLEESNQARPGTLAVINDVSDHRYLLDPSGVPEEVGEGFWIIHRINQPEEGFEVREFSDEFLERHAIFLVKPLPPVVSSGYMADAGRRGDLRVNPKLIGEPARDANNQQVMLDEGFKVNSAGKSEKWTGLLGAEQILRRKRVENPQILPRSPGVGTWKDFVRQLRDHFESRLALENRHLVAMAGEDENLVSGAEVVYRALAGEYADRRDALLDAMVKPQELLLTMFFETFTLQGADLETEYEWKKTVREAFAEAGLWSDRKEEDGLSNFLDGEGILIQSLEVFREPRTGIPGIDHILRYFQQNTVGGGISSYAFRLLEGVRELYSTQEEWGKLDFKEKMRRVWILQEVYQVIEAIIRERGASSAGPKHSPANIQQMRLLQDNIRTALLIDRDWPGQVLNLAMDLELWLSKADDSLLEGDFDSQDFLGKMVVFGDDDEYQAHIAEMFTEFLQRSEVRYEEGGTEETLGKEGIRRLEVTASVLSSMMSRPGISSPARDRYQELLTETQRKIARVETLLSSPRGYEIDGGLIVRVKKGTSSEELIDRLTQNHPKGVAFLWHKTEGNKQVLVSVGGEGAAFGYEIENGTLKDAAAGTLAYELAGEITAAYPGTTGEYLTSIYQFSHQGKEKLVTLGWGGKNFPSFAFEIERGRVHEALPDSLVQQLAKKVTRDHIKGLRHFESGGHLCFVGWPAFGGVGQKAVGYEVVEGQVQDAIPGSAAYALAEKLNADFALQMIDGVHDSQSGTGHHFLFYGSGGEGKPAKAFAYALSPVLSATGVPNPEHALLETQLETLRQERAELEKELETNTETVAAQEPPAPVSRPELRLITDEVKIVFENIRGKVLPLRFEEYGTEALIHVLSELLGQPVYFERAGVFQPVAESRIVRSLGEAQMVVTPRSQAWFEGAVSDQGRLLLDSRWLKRLMEKSPRSLYVLLSALRQFQDSSAMKEPLIVVEGDEKTVLRELGEALLRKESGLNWEEKASVRNHLLPQMDEIIRVVASADLTAYVSAHDYGVATLSPRGSSALGALPLGARFILNPDEVADQDLVAVAYLVPALLKAAALVRGVKNNPVEQTRLLQSYVRQIIPGVQSGDHGFSIRLDQYIQEIVIKEHLVDVSA